MVFLAFGSDGQHGIYDMTGGALLKMDDLNDILDGRAITGLSLSRTGVVDDPAVFEVTFDDGSQGIYIASVPDPGTIVLGGLGGCWLSLGVGCNRRRLRNLSVLTKYSVVTG